MTDAISVPANVFPCTQCGGELHPDEGQLFLTCPYCESTVYVDKSRVVFHWYLVSTLDEAKARANLARWMGGNDTVKDLDRKARLESSSFEFFPFWYFKSRDKSGAERIWLEPAAATSVSELKKIKIPAGDLRKYDDSISPQAHDPTVPLTTVTQWLGVRLPADAEVIETALVHIPIYTFKYDYKNKSYTAIVEGATGGVFANIFPTKAEIPLPTGWRIGRFYLPVPGYISSLGCPGRQRRGLSYRRRDLHRTGPAGNPLSICTGCLGCRQSVRPRCILACSSTLDQQTNKTTSVALKPKRDRYTRLKNISEV